MHTPLRLTVALSDDATLTRIGWAAARRLDTLFVVVSTRIPRWRQEVAVLEAATDREYDAYAATLPDEEQQRRQSVSACYLRPGEPPRRALIRLRTSIGRVGGYDNYLRSMPLPEQRRRDDVLGGDYSVTFDLG